MKTRIEWTEATWNPTTGCTKVSLGCQHCYAERMAHRLQAMGQARYRHGFRITAHEEALELPLKWRRPRMVFVNSMSDLFHEDLPLDFIQRVFAVMVEAHRHTFQILTKRARRLVRVMDRLPWAQNIWMGVSVENADYLWRIEQLRRVPACLRFLSLEPLLGPINELPLDGIDWVIVGGESGPKARPMNADWCRSIRDQCVSAGVPFFFKQWGGTNKKAAGRLLDGRIWDEFPSARALPDEGSLF